MKFLLLTLAVIFFVSYSSYAQKIDDSLKAVNAFILFSARTLNNKQVQLNWLVDSATYPAAYFIVERTVNNGEAEKIATIKTSQLKGNFSYTDEQPGKGNIFYQVILMNDKYTLVSNKQLVSISGYDVSCKFYPNPVENSLFVRTEEAGALQLMDEIGNIKISSTLKAGINIIDVSALSAGKYVVKIFQTPSNKIMTDKLVKH
jgi:Secretion system C-terminal sorting domain